MRLGLITGYWISGPPSEAVEAVALAEELEWDSVWTAEAYGSDALTPLAWWGSQTRQVGLGTGDHADVGPHANSVCNGRSHTRPFVERSYAHWYWSRESSAVGDEDRRRHREWMNAS